MYSEKADTIKGKSRTKNYLFRTKRKGFLELYGFGDTMFEIV